MCGQTNIQTAFERARGYQELSRAFLEETEGDPTLGGAAPPYEAQYGDPNLYQQSEELADVSGFYRACGLSAPVSERVDHLSVELEFMSFLALKEAWALHQEPERAGEIRQMQGKFLSDHLGRWVPAFSARFEERNAGLSRRLTEWLKAEMKLLEVQPKAVRTLDLRPSEDANEPFECGGGTCPIT